MRLGMLVMGFILWGGGVAAPWAQEPEATGQAPIVDDAQSPQTEVTVEAPLYPNRAVRDMTLLAQATPSDQVLWWPEGGGQVLALYNSAISAEPVGAVLFIQDQDLHAAHPDRLQKLRLVLPEQGWTTLMVTLPAPDALPVPERAKPSPQPIAETAGEAAEVRPETEEVFDDKTGTVASVAELNAVPEPEVPDEGVVQIPAAEIVDQRLSMALQYLHDQGQFNLVLIAEGAGAVRAARLAQRINYQGFRALVLLDARHQLLSETGDVLEMLKQWDSPILDLYVAQHADDPVDIPARRAAAKRAGKSVYLALQLPSYEPSQQRLIKRVRGFLDVNAKGVQVENATVIDSP